MSTVGQLTIRRLGPDDWQTLRDIRLTALADAPRAFGSSLAIEREFDEARWRSRLSSRTGMFTVGFLAGTAVGVMGVYTPEGTDEVMLIAAWVDPEARGLGVGDALVADVIGWCREQGHPLVGLRVAD